MQKFKNCVAVVTGAGSGIGRALALQLADAGADLALSDINQKGLDETLEMVAGKGVKSRGDLLDVSNRDAVFAYAQTVQDEFGRVNLVVNNAGAALSGTFAQTTMEDLQWQMDVNFWGVAYGTKAFLPFLEQAEWGHIVNISSLFGLIASPYNSAYNASKFAVRGMTECLRIELEATNSTVSCSCVHPGGVKTNIAATARTSSNNSFMNGKTREEVAANFEQVARTTPRKAADIILRGVVKNKKRILVGGDAWMIDKIQRLFPTRYNGIMSKLFGFGAMED